MSTLNKNNKIIINNFRSFEVVPRFSEYVRNATFNFAFNQSCIKNMYVSIKMLSIIVAVFVATFVGLVKLHPVRKRYFRNYLFLTFCDTQGGPY